MPFLPLLADDLPGLAKGKWSPPMLALDWYTARPPVPEGEGKAPLGVCAESCQLSMPWPWRARAPVLIGWEGGGVRRVRPQATGERDPREACSSVTGSSHDASAAATAAHV